MSDIICGESPWPRTCENEEWQLSGCSRKFNIHRQISTTLNFKKKIQVELSTRLTYT